MLIVKAPNIEFTMPTEWAEVNLRQFLNLYGSNPGSNNEIASLKTHDALKCLCSDVKQLEQLGDYEEGQIIKRLTFLSAWPDLSTLSAPVEVNNRLIPTDLGTCTLLQKWTIEEVITDRIEEGQLTDHVSLAVEMLAVYLYPILLDKPLLNSEHLNEVVPLVEALPVTVALPLSAFFLKRLTNLTPFGETVYSLQSPKAPPKKWLPRWFPNWKRIRSWRPFGRWRGGDESATSKSNNSLTLNL